MKTGLIKGRAGPLGPPRLKDGEQSQTRSGGPSGPALPRRKHLPHGVPPCGKAGEVYFLTICCVVRGENQLCRPEVSAAFFEAVQFRQARGDWHVHLLVLMPDHLHALASFPRDDAMVKVVANFKEITAKGTAVRWQGDFFEHRLRTDESFDEKALYVRMNPVRKGFVKQVEDWPYVWPLTGKMGSIKGTAGPAVPPYL